MSSAHRFGTRVEQEHLAQATAWNSCTAASYRAGGRPKRSPALSCRGFSAPGTFH